jgi:hypothetical protein
VPENQGDSYYRDQDYETCHRFAWLLIIGRILGHFGYTCQLILAFVADCGQMRHF